MLQRLYIHNFRCLENFEFKPGDEASVLLIGRNGAGKSTVHKALKVLQGIGRGVSQVGQLVVPTDRTLNREGIPIRFELDVDIDGQMFRYALALELPERFRELRVLQESLRVDDKLVFTRDHAQVSLLRQGTAGGGEARFSIDWHLVALTIIQDPAVSGSVSIFRSWLARIILLAPIPSLIGSEAKGETLAAEEDGGNLPEWLAGLLAHYPAAYTSIHDYLSQVMPDLADFQFERTGRDRKLLVVRFKSESKQYTQDFNFLSDGEKCFVLCAVLLSANRHMGPLFVFWDEPDNYLSLSEVGHMIMALRSTFRDQRGQLWMTSHNEEAIRKFSPDNTWVLGRRSHLEPTWIRPLNELPAAGDLTQALIYGDLEP